MAFSRKVNIISTEYRNKTIYVQALTEHFSDFLGETEHFSGKNGALRRSILVGK